MDWQLVAKCSPALTAYAIDTTIPYVAHVIHLCPNEQIQNMLIAPLQTVGQ